MTLGEVLLNLTLITMAPSVFQKTNFKGYFSHSQTSKCLMRFFGSGTGPWAQISWVGTIFDAKHDDWKIFTIFEKFGKSRNKVWVPPYLIVHTIFYTRSMGLFSILIRMAIDILLSVLKIKSQIKENSQWRFQQTKLTLIFIPMLFTMFMVNH